MDEKEETRHPYISQPLHTFAYTSGSCVMIRFLLTKRIYAPSLRSPREPRNIFYKLNGSELKILWRIPLVVV